jgi:tRNA A-37 threonylcarbamoyl transferase component Bud32
LDFLCQLASLVGELHVAGLVQEDLHLGNFLIANEKIYAIDGDAICTARKGHPLALKPSSRNLALLLAQIPPKFDFLLEEVVRCYAMQRSMSGTQFQSLLSRDLSEVRSRRRHNYVKKSYRSCSEFVRLSQGGQVSISRRDVQGETLSRLLEDPDAFMRNGTTLKAGNTSTVVRVRLDDCDLVIKRYNIKDTWHALSRSFRPTRAWTSWGNAHLLKVSGIATPRAIAVIEKRIGPLRSTGYYVCDFVAGVPAEKVFLDDTVEALVKEQAAGNFVHLFELFHKLNICHGDCKATNFLLRDNEPWVLDLDAMHECLSPARFKNLFQADRQRFLRNWQARPELQKWFDDHLPR